MIRAMAALPMNRASLRCLGLSVGIAIALSGCKHDQPSLVDNDGAEATDCYWFARDYTREPVIQEALADGNLTRNECDDLVMPLVQASNNAYQARVKRQAVEAARAASGMEARRAAAENTDAVHDSPTAESGDAQEPIPHPKDKP